MTGDLLFEGLTEKLDGRRKERIEREDRSQALARRAAQKAGWRRTTRAEALKYNAAFAHANGTSYANGDWADICRVYIGAPFLPGEAVVCIDADNLHRGLHPLTRGREYIVRECREYVGPDNQTSFGVLLEDIESQFHPSPDELAYHPRRFSSRENGAV